MSSTLGAGQRPREPRTKVLIPSRMRLGTCWSDVCIHNLSTRGLMVHAEDVPERGTYVDIRRGTQTIIGRVVWRRGCYFGIRAQDRINIDAVISEPRLTARPAAASAGEAERRSSTRPASEASIARRAERSRMFASAFQFGVLVLAGLGASGFVAVQAHHILARPMAAVAEKL